MTTNTERCGGVVDATITLPDGRSIPCSSAIAVEIARLDNAEIALRRRNGELLAALAEEHSKGERMAETIRTTEATLDSLNLDSRRALHRVIEDVIGINRAALVSP